MKIAKIRFLEKGEETKIPKWAKLLPNRRAYVEKRRPFRVEREGDILTGILQTEPQNSMMPLWRKRAAELLRALEKEGAGILIPPVEGELPRNILPLAEGRKLMTLFAFQGAAEALRRQGKEPSACTYLLAGEDGDIRQGALCALGNEVNRLALFTEDVQGAEEAAAALFEERGLVTEIFSSPKNPLLQEADVVFGCGFSRLPYEHILKEGCVWLELAGNCPLLRQLAARQDMTVADGFFFRQGEKREQKEGRLAEAETFLQAEALRRLWQPSPEKEDWTRAFAEGEEREWRVSGFSCGGKRVRVRRKP